MCSKCVTKLAFATRFAAHFYIISNYKNLVPSLKGTLTYSIWSFDFSLT